MSWQEISKMVEVLISLNLDTETIAAIVSAAIGG